MSTELLVPFGLSVGGQISVTTDPNVQAQQHVDSLISTTPGERAMQPAYGVDLTGQLFAPDEELSAFLVADVQQAFAAWEPTITLQGVTPVPGASNDALQGIATVDVAWSIPGATTATSTTGVTQATMLVGGSVIIDQQVIS
jgi:phage baseplate assembly protein W